VGSFILSASNEDGKPIRCTSYGQALYGLPGSKLNSGDAANWFRTFYKGLDNPLFFPFIDSETFENPSAFRLDNFADDNDPRRLYSLMIRPGFLPVGISTSNRIIKPGYEAYQPIVAAWQFILGQVPPHFHIHHLVESRADLPDTITSSRCYSIFDNLHVPIPADLSFTFSLDGFGTWWGMWKTHVFRKALGPLLQQLDPEYVIPEEEVLNLHIILSELLLLYLTNSTYFPSSNKMIQNLRPVPGNHSTSSRLALMFFIARNHHR